MNFTQTFLAGKAGKNFGLPTGIPPLDRAINGIQKKMSIGLAAAPKCGKTTLADFAFVINPYLWALENNFLHNINWIYFSYEIDRVSKEFKFAAYFMAKDFGVYNYWYKDKFYTMDMDYLMGRKLHGLSDGSSELIPVTQEHEEMLKEIYIKRIIPIFGEFDEHGDKIYAGKIDLIEIPENPTGIRNYIQAYAKQHGKFKHHSYTTQDDHGNSVVKERVVGYEENNPELFTIIIVDHIRKPRIERGFSLKQNIDKWLEYGTEIRNLCGFTFVNICHLNRDLANVDRLKYAGDKIFPTSDDVKDSGNLAEESTVLMTMFNPNDEKYNLRTHFGVELVNYPNYRSIHITEGRNVPDAPVHIQTNMIGGVNMFTKLN